jgi:putative Mn2+ efflux pump MntP
MLALALVAVSLGLDNLAAAIAIGIAGVDRSIRTRVALAFGLFEAGMPVIGLLSGRALADAAGHLGHLIGGGLLIAVGLQIVVSALRGGEDEVDRVREMATGGLSRLVLLAAALSIDNLIVGFALGTDRVSLVLSIVVIGLVSIAMSLIGLEAGSRLGESLGERAEAVGGVVLALVGIALLAGFS